MGQIVNASVSNKLLDTYFNPVNKRQISNLTTKTKFSLNSGFDKNSVLNKAKNMSIGVL